MKLKWLEEALSVCKLPDCTQIPWQEGLLFFAKTDQELSLVCRTSCVPQNAVRREDGWKALRIEGELDFSLVGILSRLTAIMADGGISVFAVSTYCTDYLLVKANQAEQAGFLLIKEGYTFLS